MLMVRQLWERMCKICGKCSRTQVTCPYMGEPSLSAGPYLIPQILPSIFYSHLLHFPKTSPEVFHNEAGKSNSNGLNTISRKFINWSFLRNSITPTHANFSLESGVEIEVDTNSSLALKTYPHWTSEKTESSMK